MKKAVSKTKAELALILIMPSVIRLFKYSFEPIHFEYKGLTPDEQKCITEDDFKTIKWLCKK
jgi:hypothetical protein